MVNIGAFLLRRFLKPQHISNKMAGEYQIVYPNSSRRELISHLLKCWTTVARTLQLVFQVSFQIEEYDKMNRLLIHSRHLLYEEYLIAFQLLTVVVQPGDWRLGTAAQFSYRSSSRQQCQTFRNGYQHMCYVWRNETPDMEKYRPPHKFSRDGLGFRFI